MEDLTFAAKYWFSPNMLKYASTEDMEHHLKEFACGRGDEEFIRKLLSRNSAMHKFVSYIAAKNQRNVFDREVLEAYFYGNTLLENTNTEEMKQLIQDNFGLDREMTALLLEHFPDSAVPTHNFHIFHLHCATKGLLHPLTNIDKARIAVGKVQSVFENELEVSYEPLVYHEKGIIRTLPKKSIAITFIPDMLPEVKKDDRVTFRWNFALDIVEESLADHITLQTKKLVEQFNAHYRK